MAADPENDVLASNPDSPGFSEGGIQPSSDLDATNKAIGTAAPSGPRNSGKKNKKPSAPQKPLYGKLRFALSPTTEKALRFAALMLEDEANMANTPQSILEEAVIRHMHYLSKRNVVQFPASLLPE